MAQQGINVVISPGASTYTVPSGNRFIGSAQASANATLAVNGVTIVQLSGTTLNVVSAICCNAGDVLSAFGSPIAIFGQLFNP